MQKPVKIVIIIVVALWVFAMGYEIGTYRETRKTQVTTAAAAVSTTAFTDYSSTVTTTAAPVTETTTAAQTNTTSVGTTAGNATATTQATSWAPMTAVAARSNAELLENVKNAINNTKSYTGSFTAVQTQTRDLTLTKCSAESLTSTIDKIVQSFIGKGSEDTYTFNGGTGTNSKGDAFAPNDVIPPDGQAFSLTESGITSITSEASGSDTVYKIALAPETATLDRIPANNAASIGYLDLSNLSILESIEYNYAGSIIEATVNGNGLLAKLNIYMPISADGVGKVGFVTGSASFSGSMTEVWTFTYA